MTPSTLLVRCTMLGAQPGAQHRHGTAGPPTQVAPNPLLHKEKPATAGGLVRNGTPIALRSLPAESGRHHEPGRSHGAGRRLGGRIGRARKAGSQDRLHSAYRLRLGRHGGRARPGQEVRRQDHTRQRSFVARRAGQAHQRRAGLRARAVRPHLWRAARHRRAAQRHGGADEPEPKRPGHHDFQQTQGQGRTRWRIAR